MVAFEDALEGMMVTLYKVSLHCGESDRRHAVERVHACMRHVGMRTHTYAEPLPPSLPPSLAFYLPSDLRIIDACDLRSYVAGQEEDFLRR